MMKELTKESHIESLGLDESIVLSNISVSEYPISQANHKQVYEVLLYK